MKLALCCTLIHAQPVLAHWVAHHRALGFEQFYLFVDDPAELADYTALPLGDVQLIPRDAALASAWSASLDWDFHQPFVATQVYARQCMNTNVAMTRARAAGCDWLLHLDSDELLHVPEGAVSLPAYFAAHAMFDLIAFTNHEAVPEQWHVDNYFAEVTLFKRNGLTLSVPQRQLAERLFGPQYFQAYANGKSAVNLRGKATEADGAHAFRPAPMLCRETTLCVLHFAHCGFNWFHEKFKTLGDFDNQLIGLADITVTFPLLAQGRAAIVRGSMHHATRLYRDRLLHQGGLPHTLPSLLEAGILMRIGESPLQLI